MSKKRKRKSFDKIMKDLGNAIVEWFKNKYKEFIGLPKKVRLVMLVWLIVIIVLVIFILIGSSNKKHIEDYYNIENEMNTAMEKYLEKNEVYATESKPLILSIDILIDEGLLDESLFDGKTCLGYSKAYYQDVQDDETTDGENVINSYLNCAGYTTKGYKENK